MINQSESLAEQMEKICSKLAHLSDEVSQIQDACDALCLASSQADDAEEECLETDALWEDTLLKKELIYVVGHDCTVNADVASRVENILDALDKHMTRRIFVKHGRPIPKELSHYVGQFGDGYGCGVFYRAHSTGEVHTRSVWKGAYSAEVDTPAFEAVIPNGEGGWKTYFPTETLQLPDADGDEESPDVTYKV